MDNQPFIDYFPTKAFIERRIPSQPCLIPFGVIATLMSRTLPLKLCHLVSPTSDCCEEQKAQSLSPSPSPTESIVVGCTHNVCFVKIRGPRWYIIYHSLSSFIYSGGYTPPSTQWHTTQLSQRHAEDAGQISPRLVFR